MVTVAEAGTADRTVLAALLGEMGRYYGEVHDGRRIAAAAEALTTPAGRAGPFCLVARVGHVPAGLVSLSGFFPALDFSWGLLLKDIFVADAARGSGAGRALMTATMRFAVAKGYTRVDWTTDASDDRARRFFAGLGIAPTGNTLYRLTGEAMAAAAQGRWPAKGSAR